MEGSSQCERGFTRSFPVAFLPAGDHPSKKFITKCRTTQYQRSESSSDIANPSQATCPYPSLRIKAPGASEKIIPFARAGQALQHIKCVGLPLSLSFAFFFGISPKGKGASC